MLITNACRLTILFFVPVSRGRDPVFSHHLHWQHKLFGTDRETTQMHPQTPCWTVPHARGEWAFSHKLLLSNGEMSERGAFWCCWLVPNNYFILTEISLGLRRGLPDQHSCRVRLSLRLRQRRGSEKVGLGVRDSTLRRNRHLQRRRFCRQKSWYSTRRFLRRSSKVDAHIRSRPLRLQGKWRRQQQQQQ